MRVGGFQYDSCEQDRQNPVNKARAVREIYSTDTFRVAMTQAIVGKAGEI